MNAHPNDRTSSDSKNRAAADFSAFVRDWETSQQARTTHLRRSGNGWFLQFVYTNALLASTKTYVFSWTEVYGNSLFWGYVCDKMSIDYGTVTITLDDVKRAIKKDNTGSDLDCHGAPEKKQPLSTRQRLFLFNEICPCGQVK